MRLLPSLKRSVAILLFALFAFSPLFAQHFTQGFWNDTKESEITTAGTRYIFPREYETFTLDLQTMRDHLAAAPAEHSMPYKSSTLILSLPMPDGSFARFRILESPIVEDPLYSNYPLIRTYDGQGIDDPSAYVRLDVTHEGFHAMVLSAYHSTVFIDPWALGDTQNYMSYYRSDFETNKVMTCDFVGSTNINGNGNGGVQNRLFGDCMLREYRLALACTGEYATFHGGTTAGALSAQVTTMNRVNGVYMRDFAVKMNIIGNNNLLIFLNSGSDPYTNNNGATMLGENQTECDNTIGSANYDIGHVFSTGGGGIAGLGVVCSNGNKARGVTGSGSPVGDPFDIDYVAHEMGHQFGANHTQNNNCNRNNATAMEPGSASTIMGYAGICAPNVQNNSDDYFHAVSLDEIYSEMQSGGHTCETVTALSNSQPVLTALPASYNIPASTPFVLTASATDPDGDVLTYCWEQYDNATATMPPVATSTGGPMFRTFDPSTDSSRYFPNLADLASGAATTWEVLPSVSRTMNFVVNVRDNSAGGSCNDNDNIVLNVDGGSGPFVVTYPSATGITWAALSNQTITWNVAGTDGSPVSCANVDIFLSTDGGLTYPITIATGVPNSGSYSALVPNNPTTTARIMVKGSNNIFFDISDNDFEITGPSNDFYLSPVNTTDAVCAPDSAFFVIDVGSTGGFSNAVTMSATGVPAGASYYYSPNPVTPGSQTTLVITNTGAAAAGNYTITVEGTSTTGTKTTTVDLSITSGAPTPVVLSSPANGATGVSTNPTYTWVDQVGSVYQIEVASDASMTTIVDTDSGFTGGSYAAQTTLATSTQYWWRVRAINGCGVGAWSPIWDFTTESCGVFTSTDVPVAISSSGTPTVTSTLSVPLTGTITSVSVVDLTGTHTYIQDLTMTLTSPGGTTITLLNQICGSQNDWDIQFDDTGAAYASIPCPPIDGNAYQPLQALSGFNGENPNGTWTLTITDNWNQDGGSLNSWALRICASPTCNLAATIPSSANVDCNGGNNGSATASGSGGTGSLTYAWSNGGSTATISSLSAGTYTVTITDQGGCQDTETITISEPTVLTAAASPSHTSCGQDNGSATASATGGNGSYGYTWNNGGTTSTITALASGTYTVTVTDANGCTDTQSVTVNSSTGVNASTAPSSTTCGQSNGSATASATGGSGSYTYSWSNGGSTATITALASGTYTVTVNDGAGCTATQTAVVGSSSGVTGTANVVSHTTCGQNNGSANASATGGSGSYSYSWSNGGNTAAISSLAAGTYTVTIDDGAGCTDIQSVTINNTNGVNASTAPSHTSCGQNNGSATASATGGSGSYTYSWSTGGSGATINSLAAGTYTVTVDDGAGCTATQTVTINSSTGVTSTASPSHTSCGQNNGSATASATGGSGSYTYSWSTGGSGATITGLSFGTYTVTVNDGAGCTSTSTVSINPSTGVSATASPTHTSCGQNNGSATASGSGGSGSYTYSWSTGGSGATITALAAGTYTVTVDDGAGCTATQNVTINSSTGVTSTASPTHTSCGQNNGAATASGSGGSGSYTYSWSNGGSGATITALASGTYTVTVDDGTGCTSTSTVTVNSSAGITATASPTHTSCGQNNGSATATATGGSGSYSYSWSNGGSGANITGLAGGTYTVTVDDGTGCTSTQTVTVNSSTAVSATASSTNPLCGQNNGSATATATGGDGSYSYSWSNGGSGTTITGLAGGTYTVTVTDGAGCTATSSVTLTAANAPTLSVIIDQDVNCFGDSTGMAAVTASGGTPNYTYAWSNGASGASISGLPAGSYTVTVTDDNGCTDVTTVTITEPASALAATGVVTDETGPGANDGSITVAPSGGTAPYTYSWSNGQTGATATGLTAGTYTCTVTDANGCTFVITENVSVFIGVNDAVPGVTITVYPNPSNGDFYLDYTLENAQDLEITVYNKLGQLVFIHKVENATQGQVPIRPSELSDGVYSVVIGAEDFRIVRKVLVTK